MTRKKKIGPFVMGKIPILSYRMINGEKFYHHGYSLTKKDKKTRVKIYNKLGCKARGLKTKDPLFKKPYWDIYARCG